MADDPAFLIENYFSDVQFSTHVVSANEEGAGTDAFRVATGRRSSQARTTPLIYGRDGDRYLVVASRGGADQHPEWYRNLVAQDEVEIQVKAERFRAHARPAMTEEKPDLWKVMTAIWPAYDQYQTRTKRDIPVVIIEP